MRCSPTSGATRIATATSTTHHCGYVEAGVTLAISLTAAAYAALRALAESGVTVLVAVGSDGVVVGVVGALVAVFL